MMTARLQRGLEQPKPFVSVEQEVILNLARPAKCVISRVADVLQTAGLTPTQYNALRILRGAGDQGLTCGDVGERMVTKDSDITRLMDRLERRSLVKRERPETNRRIVLLRITKEGLKLLMDLDNPVQEVERDQIGHLGRHRLRMLKELLEECRGAE